MNKLCDTQHELAMQLATHMIKSVGEFCFMKNISEDKISGVVYQDAFNQLAEELELGLNVRMVEELTGEPVATSKETPFEIIGRVVNQILG